MISLRIFANYYNANIDRYAGEVDRITHLIIWLSRTSSIELRPINAIKLIITMLWHLAKNASNFWAGTATLSVSFRASLFFLSLDPITERIIAKIALIADRRAVSADDGVRRGGRRERAILYML